MLYAAPAPFAEDKILASTGAEGYCRQCSQRLIPKCGRIIPPYWSHIRLKDCDSWSEGESKWHLDWKKEAGQKCCEIIIGNHRADIECDDGTIVELQHSAISVNSIEEREMFYGGRGSMIWLLDLTGKRKERLFYEKRRPDWYAFSWSRSFRSFQHAKFPILLDIGDEGLFWIRRTHNYGQDSQSNIVSSTLKGGWFGWGQIIPREVFVQVVIRNKSYKHGVLINRAHLLEKATVSFLGMAPFRNRTELAHKMRSVSG